MARRKQNPIDDIINQVGGYFGGNRGQQGAYATPPDTLERRLAQNQTQIVSSRYEQVNLPRPQSIRSMPPQLAGYKDDYNTPGQIASTENMYDVSKYFGEKFLTDINKVYVNPSFAEPASRIGNDPDSPKRATNYKPLPSYRASQLQKIAGGTAQFADAVAKYFDKDVEVLKVPDQYPTRMDPLRTLQLNIRGYEEGNNPRSLGFVSAFNAASKPLTKKTGKETYKITAPWEADMYVNTNVPQKVFPQGKSEYANTMMHEFGHNLGQNHPLGYKTGGARNSKLSYDNTGYIHGAQLLPADINTFKEVYARLDVQKVRNSGEYRDRAAKAYKGIAKKRK